MHSNHIRQNVHRYIKAFENNAITFIIEKKSYVLIEKLHIRTVSNKMYNPYMETFSSNIVIWAPFLATFIESRGYHTVVFDSIQGHIGASIH